LLRRIKLVSEARQVVRSVCLSVIAIAIVSCVMALKGWHVASLILGGLIVLIAGVLVFQVHWAVGQLNRQSNIVRQAAGQAEAHYVNVLRRIVRFVEARDNYKRGHSHRVGRLSEQIARKLSLPEARCSLLNLAGQLQDIGLMAIPERILNERTHLGADAFRFVRRHPQVSYEVLRPLESLRDVLPGIRYHHERMNGTGYPAGLVGQEIPIEARILGVADAYDAMTHDRPNHPAMAPLEAMDELGRCTPAGYDPACVEALGEIVHLPVLAKVMAGTLEPLGK